MLHHVAFATGSVTNLGLAVGIDGSATTNYLALRGDDWAAWVDEADQGGLDRNGDGDATDWILFTGNLASGSAVDTGLSFENAYSLARVVIEGEWLVALGYEGQGGLDLNGDGSDGDQVLYARSLASGSETILGPGMDGTFALVDGCVLYGASEQTDGVDYNGDGDALDGTVLQAYELASGTTTNHALACFRDWRAGEGFALLRVSEATQGADLNGDGDQGDVLLFCWGRFSGRTSWLGISASDVQDAEGSSAAFRVAELSEGVDLNGDGDQSDHVLHLYDHASGQLVNTGTTGSVSVLRAEGALVDVNESEAGLDLNGDGFVSIQTYVLHLLTPGGAVTSLGLVRSPGSANAPRLESSGNRVLVGLSESSTGMSQDLNGDGDQDDVVLFRVDLDGRVRNLGRAVRAFHAPARSIGPDDLLQRLSESSEGRDLNGDGDLLDELLYLFDE